MTQEIRDPTHFKAAASYDAILTYAKAKRICELCVVIAIAPPVLITTALAALATLGTIGGPVLDKQECAGKDGRLFRQLKLRTRAEGNGSEHPRPTLLGRFLEDSRLAELPQLWNVLVGDMSIVGPCPESPREANLSREKVPNYELCQSVRPGITGYAQVFLGRASASTRIEYDLHYIRRMNATVDLMIVWHSLFPFVARHNHVL